MQDHGPRARRQSESLNTAECSEKELVSHSGSGAVRNHFVVASETEQGVCQWLTPVILASWEAEISRIDSLGKRGSETPSQPITGCSGLSFQSMQEAEIMGASGCRTTQAKKVCETSS
jgi:hypothetical protein